MDIWQATIRLEPKRRGFHLVSDEILQQLPEIGHFETGILFLLIQHTSASLTLNENADPDVRRDFEMGINRIVPESFPYTHTCEGPDDMPAHIKASMMGFSLQIPITNGGLNLGTWQGIYLCEHRNHATGRKLVATVLGNKNQDGLKHR